MMDGFFRRLTLRAAARAAGSGAVRCMRGTFGHWADSRKAWSRLTATITRYELYPTKNTTELVG
jgi:hypothetical protein